MHDDRQEWHSQEGAPAGDSEASAPPEVASSLYETAPRQHPASADPEDPDTLAVLVKQFNELTEYVSCYVTAKADGAKLALRTTILWMSLAALGFVTCAGLILTATWLVLKGIAEGLGVLFGGRVWAGQIVTGVLLLVSLGLAMYGTVATRRRHSRRRTARKYEHRQVRQQGECGLNVAAPTSDSASHDE